METVQRAVLFVDVTDSTKLYESLGDTVALALINGVFERLEKIVAKYAGSVVKTLGDGIICVFEDPDNAFRAAVEIQTSVRSAAQDTANRLQLKIGFTCGPGDPVQGRRLRRHHERLRAAGDARQPGADPHLRADRGGALARPAHALPGAVPDPHQGQGRRSGRERSDVALRPGDHRGQPGARGFRQGRADLAQAHLPGQHLHRQPQPADAADGARPDATTS